MKKVIVYIFLAAFLFGTMEVTLKLAGNQLDSFQLTFLRFMLGGVLLLPFAFIELKRRETKLAIKDFLYLLLLGIVCIPLSMLLFQLGVMRSNASTASIIISVNPLFTMIFAHFMTDEKMNRKKLIALVIGLVGILFMINPFDMQPGNTLYGVGLVLLGAVFFGLYSVMGKISVQKMGIIPQTSISFILGSLVLLFILIVTDRPVIGGIWPENIIMVLYLSIFVTGLGYLFYFLAIAKSDATTGSIVFFVKPAIAPFMAVIILDDVIGLYGFIGIALILIASFINIREKRIANKEISQNEKDDN